MIWGYHYFRKPPYHFRPETWMNVFWSPETSSFSGKTGEKFFWVPFSSDSRPPQSDWWAAARTAGGPPKKTHRNGGRLDGLRIYLGFNTSFHLEPALPSSLRKFTSEKRLETSLYVDSRIQCETPCDRTFSLRFPVVASTLGITQCGGKGLPKRHDKMPQATKEYKGS